MKKTLQFIFLISFLMLAVMPASARKVDVDKAEKLAKHYVQSRHRAEKQSSMRLQHVHTKHAPPKQNRETRGTAATTQDTPLYHVFNLDENGGGFVIIAGDDVVRPVLGYSVYGSYDENKAPENFLRWMDGLQQQILHAQENGLPQSEEVKARWEKYLNGVPALAATNAAGHLIQTEWDQFTPYNDMCPETGGMKAPTGCVATTMAQIMKYHKHPVRGTGRSDAYVTESSSISVPSVNFEINYDWGNMLNRYDYDADSPQARKAVATLMYHCGAGTGMDYGIDGSSASSASMLYAMVKYFGYDRSISCIRRSMYDDALWEATLRGEIDAGRPLYYAGQGTGAHAFVCDGYDDDGLFHFNWGWGGWFDGYYPTSALTPSNDNYSDGQEIIVNIMPEAGGVGWGLTISELSPSRSSVEYGETFTVNSRIHSTGFSESPEGMAGTALTDDDNKIVAIVGTSEFYPLQEGYYRPVANYCEVPRTVPHGTYKLRMAFKPDGGEWKLVAGRHSYLDDRIDFEVKLNGNVTLRSLSVSTGTLSPGFNPDVIVYTVNVPNTVTSINIAATAEHGSAKVTGTGTESLKVGANVFAVTVTAEDGTTRKTYTVTVNRAASADATLKTLSISGHALSPVFNSGTAAYTVNVPNTVSSIVIEAAATHDSAKVDGTGTKSLKVGENVFAVTVTAEDGTTRKTYTVTVNRADVPIDFISFALDGDGARVSLHRTVGLYYTVGGGTPLHFRVAESEAILSDAQWKKYEAGVFEYTFASDVHELKTVYTQLRNGFGETSVKNASIYYKPAHAKMSVTSFGLNSSATVTRNRTVSLDHTVENGEPLSFSVSENLAEVGIRWSAYGSSPLFTLSEDAGLKTVYFVLANGSDTTETVSAQIRLDESGSHGLKAMLYPNPVAENFINVETDCKGAVRVNVYGLKGEAYLSRSFESATFRIDLSNCPSGILLIRISGRNGDGAEVYTVEKIIKER
jgi:hypothetical protein